MRQADSASPTEEQQSRSPAQTRFRPDIEGLRAIAVVAVVLFHAEMPGLGGGYVGVDVFFVISGFLITGLLWREANTTGTVRLRSFYGARARRLLPASATVGIITMIASVVVLPPLQVPAVLSDGVTSALYVGNYWFIIRGTDYFGSEMPPSPFLHYWSLGVEEQFYLVWAPLFLGTAWLIRRMRRRTRTQATSSPRPYLLVLAVVAAISFALSLVITYVMPAAAFFSLPTRAWQLALGGLIALTSGHWQRLSPRVATLTGWTGLALILLACTWFSPATPFPGFAALLPTVGAALIIGAGSAATSHGCGQLLGRAPMRAIGRISYSWYLWHWPVLILIPVFLGHPMGLGARLAAALASAGLAWLTLRYLENPLRFATKIRNSPGRSLALGGGVTAAAVCVGMVLLLVIPTPIGRGAPGSALNFPAQPPPAADSALAAYDTAVHEAFSHVQIAVAASADLKTVPSNLQPPLTDALSEFKSLSADGCMRLPYQGGQPECASGDTTSATTVALIGDSHAAMWDPAFQQLATQRHWRLDTLARAGCPLMDPPAATNPLSRLAQHFEQCQPWRAQIMARLHAQHPQLVAVSLWRGYGIDESATGFTAYGPEWLAGLTRLVKELRDTGAQVLVLGPVPDPHTVVPICLSGHLDDVTACTPARSVAVDETGIAAEKAATQAGGGQYADLTDLFCTTERCPVIVGNTLVYSDWSHVTLGYSRQLAPAMAALADRALAHK